MPHPRAPRDNRLIDALDRRQRIEYAGNCWRMVRDGRDALQGSRAGGRWDDGTFDVLYTSLEADGAVAEIHYHLSKGQPVFPSKIKYRQHELKCTLRKGLRFIDIPQLVELGVSAEQFGRLSCIQRAQEYTKTQEIAEATHFLGCDGLIVPNARWNCQNLVVFTERMSPDTLSKAMDHGLIDWDEWKARTK